MIKWLKKRRMKNENKKKDTENIREGGNTKGRKRNEGKKEN
jgi:hypothetical protein